MVLMGHGDQLVMEAGRLGGSDAKAEVSRPKSEPIGALRV